MSGVFADAYVTRSDSSHAVSSPSNGSTHDKMCHRSLDTIDDGDDTRTPTAADPLPRSACDSASSIAPPHSAESAPTNRLSGGDARLDGVVALAVIAERTCAREPTEAVVPDRHSSSSSSPPAPADEIDTALPHSRHAAHPMSDETDGSDACTANDTKSEHAAVAHESRWMHLVSQVAELRVRRQLQRAQHRLRVRCAEAEAAVWQKALSGRDGSTDRADAAAAAHIISTRPACVVPRPTCGEMLSLTWASEALYQAELSHSALGVGDAGRHTDTPPMAHAASMRTCGEPTEHDTASREGAKHGRSSSSSRSSSAKSDKSNRNRSSRSTRKRNKIDGNSSQSIPHKPSPNRRRTSTPHHTHTEAFATGAAAPPMPTMSEPSGSVGHEADHTATHTPTLDALVTHFLAAVPHAAPSPTRRRSGRAPRGCDDTDDTARGIAEDAKIARLTRTVGRLMTSAARRAALDTVADALRRTADARTGARRRCGALRRRGAAVRRAAARLRPCAVEWSRLIAEYDRLDRVRWWGANAAAAGRVDGANGPPPRRVIESVYRHDGRAVVAETRAYRRGVALARAVLRRRVAAATLIHRTARRAAAAAAAAAGSTCVTKEPNAMVRPGEPEWGRWHRRHADAAARLASEEARQERLVQEGRLVRHVWRRAATRRRIAAAAAASLWVGDAAADGAGPRVESGGGGGAVEAAWSTARACQTWDLCAQEEAAVRRALTAADAPPPAYSLSRWCAESTPWRRLHRGHVWVGHGRLAMHMYDSARLRCEARAAVSRLERLLAGAADGPTLRQTIGRLWRRVGDAVVDRRESSVGRRDAGAERVPACGRSPQASRPLDKGHTEQREKGGTMAEEASSHVIHDDGIETGGHDHTADPPGGSRHHDTRNVRSSTDAQGCIGHAENYLDQTQPHQHPPQHGGTEEAFTIGADGEDVLSHETRLWQSYHEALTATCRDVSRRCGWWEQHAMQPWRCALQEASALCVAHGAAQRRRVRRVYAPVEHRGLRCEPGFLPPACMDAPVGGWPELAKAPRPGGSGEGGYGLPHLPDCPAEVQRRVWAAAAAALVDDADDQSHGHGSVWAEKVRPQQEATEPTRWALSAREERARLLALRERRARLERRLARAEATVGGAPVAASEHDEPPSRVPVWRPIRSAVWQEEEEEERGAHEAMSTHSAAAAAAAREGEARRHRMTEADERVCRESERGDAASGDAMERWAAVGDGVWNEEARAADARADVQLDQEESVEQLHDDKEADEEQDQIDDADGNGVGSVLSPGGAEFGALAAFHAEPLAVQSAMGESDSSESVGEERTAGAEREEAAVEVRAVDETHNTVSTAQRFVDEYNPFLDGLGFDE